MERLVLDHEGRLAQDVDVSAPKRRPGLAPMLETEQAKSCRPQHNPGAVGHVQHAIRLLPFELVLDIYGRLRLHSEADQTQGQQESSIRVLSPCLELCLCLRVSLMKVVCAPAQQTLFDSVVLGLAPQQRGVGAAIGALEGGSQVGGHGWVVVIPIVKVSGRVVRLS